MKNRAWRIVRLAFRLQRKPVLAKVIELFTPTVLMGGMFVLVYLTYLETIEPRILVSTMAVLYIWTVQSGIGMKNDMREQFDRQQKQFKAQLRQLRSEQGYRMRVNVEDFIDEANRLKPRWRR